MGEERGQRSGGRGAGAKEWCCLVGGKAHPFVFRCMFGLVAASASYDPNPAVGGGRAPSVGCQWQCSVTLLGTTDALPCTTALGLSPVALYVIRVRRSRMAGRETLWD